MAVPDIGAAVGGVIVTALVTLNLSNRQFGWYWLTHWMIVGALLVVIGLALLIVTALRIEKAAPVSHYRRTFNGIPDEAAKAGERAAEALSKHMTKGILSASGGPSDASRG